MFVRKAFDIMAIHNADEGDWDKQWRLKKLDRGDVREKAVYFCFNSCVDIMSFNKHSSVPGCQP